MCPYTTIFTGHGCYPSSFSRYAISSFFFFFSSAQTTADASPLSHTKLLYI